MKTLMKTALTMTALTTLTACDRGGSSDIAAERADSTYRAAMDDYQAGRLPQAIAGLKKACAANPANASARFQLACLLQDSQKDYMGAFCAYREYLLQRPDSEKAKLAADRLAACEREMAKALAEKHAPKSAQEALRAAQESRAARSKAESDLAKLEKQLVTSKAELASLRQENARLRSLIKGVADEKSGESLDNEIAEALALKNEGVEHNGVKADEIAEAQALKNEEVARTGSKDDEIAEAIRLLDGDAANEGPMLPADKPVAKPKQTAETTVRAPADYPHEPRPATYVVQEGDTLYKIAVRFYGRASAWNRIRAANRATISVDGRVRVGQKLVLPDEK